MTPTTLRLLRFVDRYQKHHGIAPSFEEMRTALGLASRSGVHRILAALEGEGFIRRERNQIRAIEIVKAVPYTGEPAYSVEALRALSDGAFAALLDRIIQLSRERPARAA